MSLTTTPHATSRDRRTLFGCTLATVVSGAPVLNASFGVFLVPISRDLGWTRAQTSALLTAALFASTLFFPLVGRAADRFGALRVAVAGNALFALAVALPASLGRAHAAGLATFAVIGAAAAIPSGVVLSPIVAAAFDRTRGLALGLVGGIGNGVGASVMPIVAAAALAAYGWRGSYLTLALLTLVVGQLALATVPSAPVAAPATGGLPLGRALRTRHLPLVIGLASLGAGALNAVFTHLVAFATDRGLPAGAGAAATAAMALTGSASQLVFGAVLDRARSPRVVAPVFLLAAVGCVLAADGDTQAQRLAGSVLAGAGLGTEYAAVPFLLSRYFGLGAFGAINGFASAVNAAAIGLAPVLLDFGFDQTGSYGRGVAVAALVLVVTAGLTLALPRAPRSRE